LGIAYSYSTDKQSVLSCTATWQGGAQDTVSFPFHLELSSPTATAVASRPPDAHGWYNHPVGISYQERAFSGIAACTPPRTYAGPGGRKVKLSGSCTDNAGKSASASLTLRYATPPSLSFTADPGDRTATLHWRVRRGPAPLTSVQVVRSPGLRRKAPSVLSRRSAASYADSHVRNGAVYRYTVKATDQAGNVSVRSVVVRPGRRLLSPAPGAHVSAPPMLRWTSVPNATYYNVQVFRGGKILSTWPKGVSLRLARSWQFGGHRYRLRRGTYRWYVWPGFGPRAASSYGAKIGSGTFVVG
jgi:hypothetical protein